MGGDIKFPYPKTVWSPVGGWWCNPRTWPRNTAFAGAVVGSVSLFTIKYATARQVKDSELAIDKEPAPKPVYYWSLPLGRPPVLKGSEDE
eukprot:CAMPEP_0205822222 /NCGR_PEP_ID=MMETSP0206-20130828/11640_1 /ASSEMBLY_ACC=CAM_ASM_000279 /TAXON_ID=36767 /ORGANISM="Euplotes focardii, Strain TN1" /LENGTH=89 /DNA_ID=CAMNT_0053118323 /DNA_START=36 /DNA_END=305 /DNA_ORIENTATION=+